MRVLTVLELLQAHERVSGAALAARLEVSVRTVQRYVARLQDLGVPVESTRGPGGAYRLRPGFRLPPLMFGTDEAFALALGLDALAYLGLGEIAPATAGVQAKLARLMPAAVSAQVAAARAALFLDRPRHVTDTDVAILVALAGAAWTGKRVRLRYLAGSGAATTRTVEPFGVMQHDGRWFLAGYCLLRDDRRLFRVDRIERAEVLAELFDRPVDFDLRAFVYERIALADARWPVEIWLPLPPATVEARLPRATAVLEAVGDGTRLRCTATDLEEFAVLLLQIGCSLTIRQPPELRSAFRAVAARALATADAATP